MSKTLILKGLLLLCSLVIAGCDSGEWKEKGSKDKSKKQSKAKPVLVELAEVNVGPIEKVLERSAPLEAEAQVQVNARTSNPAVDLLVEEGDKVKKGQILLRLENDRQKNDFDSAKSLLDKEQIDFLRQENLYKDNLISEQEYRNAKFSLSQRQLNFEEAQRQFEYTEVRAPIDGTITMRDVKVGDQVSSGGTIFEIIDFESTVAVIHVPEQYLPELKPNMEARLISSTLGADNIIPAYVKRISPIVEARAGTVKVTVGVNELGALRPGMWVDVELVLNTKREAILIPKKSIIYDNDQTYAFKMHINSTNGVKSVKRQLVLPLNADKVHIEPTNGFDVGEKIVIAGQSGLKEDSLIRELGDPIPGKTNAVPSTVSTNVSTSLTTSTKASVKVAK